MGASHCAGPYTGCPLFWLCILPLYSASRTTKRPFCFTQNCMSFSFSVLAAVRDPCWSSHRDSMCARVALDADVLPICSLSAAWMNMEKIPLSGLHFPTHFRAAGASGRAREKAQKWGEKDSAECSGRRRRLQCTLRRKWARESQACGGAVGFQAEKKEERERELQCSLSGRWTLALLGTGSPWLELTRTAGHINAATHFSHPSAICNSAPCCQTAETHTHTHTLIRRRHAPEQRGEKHLYWTYTCPC